MPASDLSGLRSEIDQLASKIDVVETENELKYLYNNEAASILHVANSNPSFQQALKSSTAQGSTAQELLELISKPNPTLSHSVPAICYAFKYIALETSNIGKINWIDIIKHLNENFKYRIVENYHHILPTFLMLALDEDETVMNSARHFLMTNNIKKIGLNYYDEIYAISKFLIQQYGKKESIRNIFDSYIKFANYMIEIYSNDTASLSIFINHFNNLLLPSIEYYKDKNINGFCTFLKKCSKLKIMTDQISNWLVSFDATGSNSSDFIFIISSCDFLLKSEDVKINFCSLCKKSFSSIQSLDIFYPVYDSSLKKYIKPPINTIINLLLSETNDSSGVSFKTTVNILITQIKKCSLMTIFHSSILENLLEFFGSILSFIESDAIYRTEIYNFLIGNIFIGVILNYAYDDTKESIASNNFLKKALILISFIHQNWNDTVDKLNWSQFAMKILKVDSNSDQINTFLKLSEKNLESRKLFDNIANNLIEKLKSKINETCHQNLIQDLSLILKYKFSNLSEANQNLNQNKLDLTKVLDFFEKSNIQSQNSLFNSLYGIIKFFFNDLDKNDLEITTNIMMKFEASCHQFGNLLISHKKYDLVLSCIEKYSANFIPLPILMCYFNHLLLILSNCNELRNTIIQSTLILLQKLFKILQSNEGISKEELAPYTFPSKFYSICELNDEILNFLLEININLYSLLINSIFNGFKTLFDLDESFQYHVALVNNWISRKPILVDSNIQFENDSFRLNCFKLAKNMLCIDSLDKSHFCQESLSLNVEIRNLACSSMQCLEGLVLFDKICVGFLKLGLSLETDCIDLNFSIDQNLYQKIPYGNFKTNLAALDQFKEENKPHFAINYQSIESMRLILDFWPENETELIIKEIDDIIQTYLLSITEICFDKSLEIYIKLLNIEMCKFFQKYEHFNPSMCHSLVCKFNTKLVSSILAEPSLCLLSIKILPYQFLNDVKAAPEIVDHTLSELINPFYKDQPKYQDSQFFEIAVAAHLISIFKFYLLNSSQSVLEVLKLTFLDNINTKYILNSILDRILYHEYPKKNKLELTVENLLSNAISTFTSQNFLIFSIDSILYALFTFILTISPKSIDNFSLNLSKSSIHRLYELIESVSPLILNSINEDLQENQISELTVSFSVENRKISARYVFESVPFDIFISFPKLYPLKPLELEFGGMTLQNQLSEWKVWCNRLKIMLTLQKISIGKCLRTWRGILDNKLLVLEECIICFGVLHTRSKKQPDKQCSSCKKIFHDDCLYKWLKTSPEPTCPHCREYLNNY